MEYTTAQKNLLLVSPGPPIFGIMPLRFESVLNAFYAVLRMCTVIRMFLSKWCKYLKLSWLRITLSHICILVCFSFLPATKRTAFEFYRFWLSNLLSNHSLILSAAVLAVSSNLHGILAVTTTPRPSVYDAKMAPRICYTY